jgi:hypothetical protein
LVVVVQLLLLIILFYKRGNKAVGFPLKRPFPLSASLITSAKRGKISPRKRGRHSKVSKFLPTLIQPSFLVLVAVKKSAIKEFDS